MPSSIGHLVICRKYRGKGQITNAIEKMLTNRDPGWVGIFYRRQAFIRV
jgi:hypothetical protein